MDICYNGKQRELKIERQSDEQIDMQSKKEGEREVEGERERKK